MPHSDRCDLDPCSCGYLDLMARRPHGGPMTTDKTDKTDTPARFWRSARAVTVADAWRAEVAKVTAERDTERARVVELEAAAEDASQIPPLPGDPQGTRAFVRWLLSKPQFQQRRMLLATQEGQRLHHRAEAAEQALADLRGRIEGLAGDWDARQDMLQMDADLFAEEDPHSDTSIEKAADLFAEEDPHSDTSIEKAAEALRLGECREQLLSLLPPDPAYAADLAAEREAHAALRGRIAGLPALVAADIEAMPFPDEAEARRPMWAAHDEMCARVQDLLTDTPDPKPSTGGGS